MCECECVMCWFVMETGREVEYGVNQPQNLTESRCVIESNPVSLSEGSGGGVSRDCLLYLFP